MSCITQLLEMKGDKPFWKIDDHVVIEGGGVYKDYEYLIVFVAHGHRCGYVALKETETERFLKQRASGEDTYYYPDIECHGGVTFFDDTHKLKKLLPIPCTDFWVGFDAAHCWDKCDFQTAEKYFGETDWVKFKKKNTDLPDLGDVHRQYEYMESECFRIIDQLTGKSEVYEHE